MLYLLYGEDDLAVEEAIASFKNDVGSPDLLDVNMASFVADKTSFAEVSATCNTVPFLAEKRLVIVKGLLGRFESTRSTGRRRQSASSGQSRLGDWEDLPGYVGNLPPTTDLVLADRRVGGSNPMLVALRPLAEVRTFPAPSGTELLRWIQDRAQSYGASIEPLAVNALADNIGQELRLLDSELRKLALYRLESTIRADDVSEMVSYVKEANVFAAVDAVLDGRTGIAIRLVHQILQSGRPATYLITMVARQVRLLILAKDLKAQRTPPDEIGKRLSISGYPLRKTLDQEGRFSHQRLAYIHKKLMEADLSIKSSSNDDSLVLDMLIADLATGR